MRDDHHEPVPHPERCRDRCRVPPEAVRVLADDLALTGGAGAAAGSRGTEVSVENRGSAACTLARRPSVAILDAAGTAIIESQPAADEPGPTLEPGGVTTFTILVSNWCEEAALPLRVVLRSGSTGHRHPGSRHDRRRSPAVQRPGQPAALSANPWQPVEGLSATAVGWFERSSP